MTANPPPVKVEPADSSPSTTLPERPEELGEVEKFLFPRWLDHDPATGGPNYLGYVMWMITFGLAAVFAVLAMIVLW